MLLVDLFIHRFSVPLGCRPNQHTLVGYSNYRVYRVEIWSEHIWHQA